MHKTYHCEVIIIKKAKIGEADNRLTVLSKYRGKLVVIAKGVRKINSRKAPFIDLFSHVNLFLASGKTFDIITDVASINNFPFLKSEIKRIAQTFKLVELTDRLLPEGLAHQEIFSKLLNSLLLLNDQNFVNLDKIGQDFALFLLWNLGFLPKENQLSGIALDLFLEEVMEKKIKSNQLLTKLA